MSPRDWLWIIRAMQVLGPCSCLKAYRERKLIDPSCLWHEREAEFKKALEEAYQAGLSEGWNAAKDDVA